MKKSFINKWIELMRPIFPLDARIEIEESNDIAIKIVWKLSNDPERLNKRSRLIKIIISEEAVEDCQDFDEASHKFKDIVLNRYSAFNPDHDNPREVGPPVEEWLISTNDLN